jgi:predicted ATPase
MLWDRVVLTPKEADVVQAIQLVDPSIERIALLSSLGPSRPQMMVKRTGADEPLPLGTMGDGAKRLVVLSVNLVNAANGFLLVDEIDTGLHYSVLAPMWRLVLATARRMNVQVFASTHSLDCVRALAWALERDPDYAEDTSVHRVVRGRHETVRYSAGELRLAVEEDMEIR